MRIRNVTSIFARLFWLPIKPSSVSASLFFLTIIPFPYHRLPQQSKHQSYSNPLYSLWLIGGLIGMISGYALILFDILFGSLIAAVMATAFGSLISGGVHEDGLADSFDGLGVISDTKLRSNVARDSNIGAIGSLALFFGLSIKIACYYSLITFIFPDNPIVIVAAITVAAGFSRTSIALCILLNQPAEPLSGSGKIVASADKLAILGSIILSCLMVFAIIWMFFPNNHTTEQASYTSLMYFSVILICITISTFLLSAQWRNKFNGIIGDNLGASQQINELIILLSIIAVQRIA